MNLLCARGPVRNDQAAGQAARPRAPGVGGVVNARARVHGRLAVSNEDMFNYFVETCCPPLGAPRAHDADDATRHAAPAEVSHACACVGRRCVKTWRKFSRVTVRRARMCETPRWEDTLLEGEDAPRPLMALVAFGDQGEPERHASALIREKSGRSGLC